MYRFLMIEDDIQICEVVQDFFARESKGTVQIETAQDGELGLEKFYENEFDLVLLDIMLPGMNGVMSLYAQTKYCSDYLPDGEGHRAGYDAGIRDRVR